MSHKSAAEYRAMLAGNIEHVTAAVRRGPVPDAGFGAADTVS